jgi:predicted Fe-Mo cluster-binding NifX family protein
MRIALPIDGKLVSTVFDFAERLCLVDIEAGRVRKQQEVDFADKLASLRVAQLKRLGIDALICGAISEPVAMMIHHSGIDLLSGITGDVDDVVSAYMDSRLDRPQYRLPGFGDLETERKEGR